MKSPSQLVNELKSRIDTIADPVTQISEMLDFSIAYGDCLGQNTGPFLVEVIERSKKHGFLAGEVVATLNLLFYQNIIRSSSGIEKYLPKHEEVPALLEKIKEQEDWYYFSRGMFAYYYWFRGEYEKGFNVVFETLRVRGQVSILNSAWSHYALGVFYFDTKDLENSRLYHEKAIKEFGQLNFTYGVARALNGIASCHIQHNELSQAVPLLSKAEGIYRELSHHSGLSRTLNDMALVAKAQNDLTRTIGLLEECIELRREIEHIQGLATSLTELGELYYERKEFRKSHAALDEALEYSMLAKSAQKEMRVQKIKYELTKSEGNTAAALEHFEKFYALRTKLLSDETANSMRKLQSKFDKEKAERETEIERLRNVELKKAYEVIESKNKDIHDSITYAKRIQSAILAHEDEIRTHFEESFLIYKPKDIVAGDFYFFEATDSHVFYAAADCTGHGVPGALVSVVCANALSRSVKEFNLSDPGKVLDKTRELVLETFGKGATDVKDGMDISLIVKDINKKSYSWAGANNPLWYISKGQFCEITPNKQPIGLSDKPVPFTTHTVPLSVGDQFFLFTDGYADQFGGPRGKKFKYKQLGDIMLSGLSQPIDMQKSMLDSAFENWKGELEQVDDVCIIGVRA